MNSSISEARCVNTTQFYFSLISKAIRYCLFIHIFITNICIHIYVYIFYQQLIFWPMLSSLFNCVANNVDCLPPPTTTTYTNPTSVEFTGCLFANKADECREHVRNLHTHWHKCIHTHINTNSIVDVCVYVYLQPKLFLLPSFTACFLVAVEARYLPAFVYGTQMFVCVCVCNVLSTRHPWRNHILTPLLLYVLKFSVLANQCRFTRHRTLRNDEMFFGVRNYWCGVNGEKWREGK